MLLNVISVNVLLNFSQATSRLKCGKAGGVGGITGNGNRWRCSGGTDIVVM